ncbi:TPA: fimbrial protein [Serratia marcescens]
MLRRRESDGARVLRGKGHRSVMSRRLAGICALVVTVFCTCAQADTGPGPANPSAELTMEAAVSKGACEFTFPPKVDLGKVSADEFTRNGGTGSMKPFTLTIGHCVGGGGTLRAGVVFEGRVLNGTNGTVFNDEPAGQAGFMFKEGTYTGTLADFRDAPGTVMAGKPTYGTHFTPGEVPAEGTQLAYTAGFVSLPGVRPAQGNVVAKIVFRVSYE